MIGLGSIRSRILAFAVLATLVPSLGLGILTYWRYQALASANVAVELRTLGNYARSELALWIGDRVEDVRALSSANTLVEGLSTMPGQPTGARPIGPREIGIYLRSVREKLRSILALTVHDADGRVVAGSAESTAPIALPAAWSEHGAVEGVVQFPPRWDGERATTTLTVVVPVLSPGNDFLGALSVVLDLGRFQPRLERIARASAAEVVLLAADGGPVLSSRASAAELKPVDARTLRRMQSRPGEPASYVGHHGREVVGLVGPPGPSSIGVVVERDSADVYRERRRLLELFAGLTGALTLFVGVLAWWIGRSIVTPLEGLVGAVDRIAVGDLGVRLREAGTSEVSRLTRAFNEMVGRLRTSREEVDAAQEALKRQNRLLEELSVTDGLTQLNNRKRLDAILAEQLALFRRHRRPFAVIMLDLDHFKALNDTYGHLAGDQVLASVAGLLKRCVRSVDHVARYGGEEFAAVLVESTLEGALDTAERIRSAVQGARIVADDRPIQVTVSLGVTRSREGDTRPEDLLARADAALYEAKRAGRNRAHCAQ